MNRLSPGFTFTVKAGPHNRMSGSTGDTALQAQNMRDMLSAMLGVAWQRNASTRSGSGRVSFV